MNPQQMDTVYINLFLDINKQTVQQIMSLCTDLVGKYDPKSLYFILSSSGGEVAAGFTLYNFLVALPTEIVMHNAGTVDSIATVVFLSGTKRYASPHSTFLYHGVSFNVGIPMSFTLEQLKERVSSLAADQARIAQVIADKTKLTFRKVQKYQRQGETLDPKQAKEVEIIEEILDVNVPQGAPLINMVA